MAETIGRAYIRILADGSGFDESIKKQVKESEPAIRDGAKRHADAYDDEFNKRTSQKDIGKGIRESLERSVARTNIAKAYFGSRDWDRFVGRLKKEAGQAGILAGHELEVEFRHNIEGLDEAVANIGPRIEKAAKRLADAAAEATPDFENLTETIGETVDEIDDLTESEDEASDSHERHRRSLNRLRDAMDNFREMNDRVAEAVGRAFGRGSRNDFINFFGSLIGNLTRIPSLLAGVGEKIIVWGEDVQDAFRGVNGGFTGLIAASGKIAPAIGSAIVAFTAFAVGLGTITTALLLAAGAAAALVSTIAFGLVGALAPLVGLLGPLSLAAGGLAVAFIGMSDAAKKSVKEAFRPLKDELKALGDAARPGILDGITAAAENLEKPMQRLKPLFKVVGDSIGQFIDTVSKVSFGPGFEKFVDTMTATLPSTMQSLGTIVGNTLDGLAGLFATLQPVTDTFLDSLERISGAFADWSISPEAGTFFDHAASSASALLDFLGPVWDLTKEILGAGRKTGNDLFREMGDAISGWVDTLKANPDLLRSFFADAKRMGEAIGDVIVQIGKLIGALDTPLTRDFAVGLIRGLGKVIEVVADLVGAWGELNEKVQGFTIALGLALVAWGPLSRALTSGSINTFITMMETAEGRTMALASAAKFAAGVGGLATLGASLQDATSHGSTFANVLTGTLGGAMTGLSLGGPIGALIGGVAGGGLTALAGAFLHGKDAAEKLRDEIGKPLVAQIDTSAVENLLELLAKAHGNYKLIAQDSAAQAVENAAGGLEKLSAAISAIGLRKDTIASAFAGDPQALKLVTDAMAGLSDKIKVGDSILDTFSDKVTETNFAHLTDDANAAGAEITDLNTAFESGLIGAQELAEGTTILNAALEDGIISGKEYAVIQDFNRSISDKLTTTMGKQQAALQTLTNITGDAAAAQALLAQNNEEGADAIGRTVDELHKLPKKVQTDIGLNGAPETRDQALDLLHEFGKFLKFKDIKTVISAPGIELTRGQIKKLAEQAKLTPKQIKILLKTEGLTKTNRDITNVGKKADEAGKKKREVKFEAKTEDFDTRLAHIKEQIRELPQKKGTAKFDADTKQFDNRWQHVKTQLGEADRKIVTPEIHADESEAMSSITNVQTGLNNLHDKYITIHVNTVRTGEPTASGGIFSGAQTRLIGEAGPEAVVPLSRPLSQVDPAVRELSAIAQGMRFASRQTRPVAQRVVDVGGIQIITPTRDPGAVAQEMVNRLVAVGY